METNYRKHLFWLLLIISIIKIVVAGLVELGNDEVYYWTYAVQPDFNHFDHPPMVGLLIRLTSFNLHWASGISLRLGSIICCAISSYFIFLTGKTIANERVGWYATLIYNASVYAGFIAGLFILPDSPQMTFWTAALYLMSQIIILQKDKKLSYWLALGVLIGLACLCKVHGLYLWAGFGLFILLKRTKWLLNWRIYLGFIPTLLCFAPILYWNIQNNFITYRFHSERVSHTSLLWDGLLQEILGEFAYQNPVIYIGIISAAVFVIRNKIKLKSNINTWLICMSVPMILFFWLIALLNPSLPHWSGPGFLPLYFIGAIYLSEKTSNLYPLFIKIGGGIVLFVLAAGVLLANFAPSHIGGSDKMENYGANSLTLDISGWQDFGKAFKALEETDVASGLMKTNAPILVNNWFPAGHLLFYVARQTGQPVIGMGKLTEIHKFAWLNKQMPQIKIGDDAYCIVPSNQPVDVEAIYGTYYTSIQSPVTINQVRGGKMVRYFKVYRLKQCKLLPPSIIN